jgi:uncharacterized protein (DUF58 family)
MNESNKYSSPEILTRIKSLQLRARQAVLGTMSGNNRSPRLGQSSEFVDYREYVPGDDLKNLDWKVFGRSGRYFIKRFEEESNLRAHLLLDGSASMAYGRGAMTKYDYAATLAASLATLLTDQRDAVSLSICDTEEREHVPPGTSALHLTKIMAELERSKPERTTELGTVITQKSDRIPARGVVVLISDLLTDLDLLEQSLVRLRQRGHDIVVFHVLDPDELLLPFDGQIEFHDLESPDRQMVEPKYIQSAYQEAMREFCQRVRSRLGEMGAECILLRTDEDLGHALSFFLHQRQHLIGRGRQGAGAFAFAGARRTP